LVRSPTAAHAANVAAAWYPLSATTSAITTGIGNASLYASACCKVVASVVVSPASPG
jgi:hypothetical protein